MSLYTHPSIPSDYDAFSSTNALNYTPISRDYSRDFFSPKKISSPKDTETPVESLIPLSPYLSLENAYAQPIGIEQANRITWTKLKRLLTNKYCPQTEIKKMEDEFYGLTVKENDLKTYIRRFQELAVLCPNMVPNTEKLMVRDANLGRSIWGQPQKHWEVNLLLQNLIIWRKPPT
ncbi:reverse transcriptase domain-containing protein [Tanacetum coccineum]